MCTIVLAFDPDSDVPVLLAANRDERLDRLSTPPARTRVDGTWALAPTDQVKGGTWIGINAHRLVVAITNRARGPRDPERLSRGHLVRRALGCASPAEVRDWVTQLDGGQYNGFHLVVANANEAFVAIGNGETLDVRNLVPGRYAFTEQSFGESVHPREARLLEELAELGPLASSAELVPLLRIRGDAPFSGTWISVPELNYGTRSSTRIEVPRAAPLRLWHAEGPPPDTEWVDYSADAARLESASESRQ